MNWNIEIENIRYYEFTDDANCIRFRLGCNLCRPELWILTDIIAVEYNGEYREIIQKAITYAKDNGAEHLRCFVSNRWMRNLFKEYGFDDMDEGGGEGVWMEKML